VKTARRRCVARASLGERAQRLHLSLQPLARRPADERALQEVEAAALVVGLEAVEAGHVAPVRGRDERRHGEGRLEVMVRIELARRHHGLHRAVVGHVRGEMDEREHLPAPERLAAPEERVAQDTRLRPWIALEVPGEAGREVGEARRARQQVPRAGGVVDGDRAVVDRRQGGDAALRVRGGQARQTLAQDGVGAVARGGRAPVHLASEPVERGVVELLRAVARPAGRERRDAVLVDHHPREVGGARRPSQRARGRHVRVGGLDGRGVGRSGQERVAVGADLHQRDRGDLPLVWRVEHPHRDAARVRLAPVRVLDRERAPQDRSRVVRARGGRDGDEHRQAEREEAHAPIGAPPADCRAPVR
jgi:hypothetical protein